MKRTFFTTALFAVAMLVLLAGCMDNDDKERIKTLEKEVAELKAEIKQREDVYKDEIGKVRKNLEAMQELLEAEKKKLAQSDPPTAEELEEQAKAYVGDKFDKLMDMTRGLLDKMEKELDEQFQGFNEPETPEGDQI